MIDARHIKVHPYAVGARPQMPQNSWEYDQHLYSLQYVRENAFLELKRWHGIAARYAKNTSSFLAAVHVRYIAGWLKSMSDTIPGVIVR